MASTSKIHNYSSHLSTTLIPALQIVRDQIAQTTLDIEEYQDLLVKLTGLKDAQGRQETLTELGGGIWADAQVYDTTHVTLDLGLGVHMDLPIDQALQYTKDRIQVLAKKRGSLRGKEEVINWQIEQFRGAMQEVAQDSTVTA